MTKLKYVTEEGIIELSSADNIWLNQSRYDTGDFSNLWDEDEKKKYIKPFELNIDLSGLNLEANDKIPKAKRPQTDKENIKKLFKKLKNIKAFPATSEGLWVWLTHFHFHEYVKWRYPCDNLPRHPRPTGKKRLPLKESKENDTYLSHIRNHWFLKDAQGMKRDNGISRLFWSGLICEKYVNESNILNFDEILDAIFTTQDIRNSIIDRSEMSSHSSLILPILEMIHKRNISNKKIGETPFRALMREANQINGAVISEMNKSDLDSRISILEKKHLT